MMDGGHFTIKYWQTNHRLGFLSQENSVAGMAGRSGSIVKLFNCWTQMNTDQKLLTFCDDLVFWRRHLHAAAKYHLHTEYCWIQQTVALSIILTSNEARIALPLNSILLSLLRRCVTFHHEGFQRLRTYSQHSFHPKVHLKRRYSSATLYPSSHITKTAQTPPPSTQRLSSIPL
jgi:hypothetical protein